MKGIPVIRRRQANPMQKTGPSKRARSERGQGIVEFALGVPLLLIILLGTIDMGRMFFEYIELRGAVREAVAAAARATCGTADSIATQAVLAHSDDLNDGGTHVKGVAYSPACPTSFDDPAATITVEASREFQPIFTEFLEIYFGMNGAVDMKASASAKVWT